MFRLSVIRSCGMLLEVPEDHPNQTGVTSLLLRNFGKSLSPYSNLHRPGYPPSQGYKNGYHLPSPLNNIIASLSLAVSRSTVIFQPLAEVADVPHSLIDRHRTFLNPLIGAKFLAHIGPRGKKSANGRTWTREMFLTSFCDELYPNLSPEARDQYERILGPVCLIPSHCHSFVINIIIFSLTEDLLVSDEPLCSW